MNIEQNTKLGAKGNLKTNTKIEVIVCMGSSCFARGNAQNLEFLETYIKENNLDATIELAGSRCEGLCADGPNIVINNIQYDNVNEDKIKKILNELSRNQMEG